MQPIVDRVHVAFRLALVLLAALFLSLPAALADDAEDRERLDRLFAQLAVAPDAERAHAIDQQIWMIWTTPSDPTLAGRMNEVLSARTMGDPIEAIVLLNRLIEDYPGYAEAWNQRATMYYMIGNYNASIADCAKVLELEPRHFGALSGRALMYLQLGERNRALNDMRAAIAVHPFLNERELFPELADEEITRI
jgi:tetratricopeptide (TPR) repeat protein